MMLETWKRSYRIWAPCCLVEGAFTKRALTAKLLSVGNIHGLIKISVTLCSGKHETIFSESNLLKVLTLTLTALIRKYIILVSILYKVPKISCIDSEINSVRYRKFPYLITKSARANMRKCNRLLIWSYALRD